MDDDWKLDSVRVTSHIIMWHLDGVPWFEASAPSKWRRCKPQTMALHDGKRVHRCACGAIRVNGGLWIDRNHKKRTR